MAIVTMYAPSGAIPVGSERQLGDSIFAALSPVAAPDGDAHLLFMFPHIDPFRVVNGLGHNSESVRFEVWVRGGELNPSQHSMLAAGLREALAKVATVPLTSTVHVEEASPTGWGAPTAHGLGLVTV